MIGRFWRTGLVVACAAFWTLTLGAQGQDPPEAFVPVKPGELGQEQLPAAPLVFAAYAFVWLALVVYVLFLWRRLTRVERELSEVSARLQAKRP